MDNLVIESPASWKDQVEPLQVLLAHNLLKIVMVFGAVFLVVFVLVGFVYAILVQFSALVFLRLAFVWNPAFQLAGRLLGVHGMPARLARPPTLYVLFSIPFLLFHAALIAGLVWIMFQTGFCGQNIICLLANSILI